MSIKEVKRYDWAHLSGAISGDESRAQYGLAALGEQYTSFGIPEDDPVIGEMLSRASQSLEATGKIGDVTALKAMQLYSSKRQAALGDSTVKEVVYDLFRADKIDGFGDKLKALVGKHSGLKLSDLGKGDKLSEAEKEEHGYLSMVIKTASKRYDEVTLFPKMVKRVSEGTIGGLEKSLVQKEEEAKKPKKPKK